MRPHQRSSLPLLAVLTVVGVALALMLNWQTRTDALPTRSWTPELEREAVRNNRSVILFFTAEWCGYCKMMLADTFTDKRVVALLQNTDILIVDCTAKPLPRAKQELVNRYNVSGFPTLVFKDSSGKDIPGGIVDSYMDGADFSEVLRGLNINR